MLVAMNSVACQLGRFRLAPATPQFVPPEVVNGQAEKHPSTLWENKGNSRPCDGRIQKLNAPLAMD